MANTPPTRRPAPVGDGLATGSSAPRVHRPAGIEAALGLQVRGLRKKHGLTVIELAGMAGLSVGMLSKIENGATSPSLTTLQTLAEALNVPITTLFASFEDRRDVSFVPAGEGLRIERRGTRLGHEYRLLGHSVGVGAGVEPYLIILSEDAEPHAAFQHEGVEFIYMLEGEVLYRHGAQTYRLGPGDSIYFDAGAPHGPEELIRLPSRYLSVIVYPQD